MPAPRPVTVLGKTYSSLRAACAAFGHRDQMIHHRLKAGMSLEQALLVSNRYTGAKAHPSYTCWNAMISRCYSPGCGGYRTHGARGVRVCERWRNDFWAFAEDMGERPSKAHSLDRIDNSKGYEPSNCRWVTNDVQQRNRRTSRLIEFDGETLCVEEWARRLGVDGSTITHRLSKGWSVADALTTPSRKNVQAAASRQEQRA